MPDADPVLPGRSCEGCAMCCQLLGIGDLDKPAGTWCRHCPTHAACEIYETRPPACRSFLCGWLTWDRLDEAWRPRDCGFMVSLTLGGRRLAVTVDPARPDAWRADPYHARLRRWAAQGAPHGVQVMVSVGNRVIVIQPDRDHDLGPVTEDQVVVTLRRKGEDGSIRLEAMRLARDDPRLRGKA